MEEKQCARCGETKELKEFCLTYKNEPSTRCAKCCKIVSKEIYKSVMTKHGYMYQTNIISCAKKKQKNYKISKPKHDKIKVKMHNDYVDDAVRRGEYSKADGAYYKAQNRSAKLSGDGGVYHGTIR